MHSVIRDSRLCCVLAVLFCATNGQLALSKQDDESATIESVGEIVISGGVAIRCEVSSNGNVNPTIRQMHVEDGTFVRAGDVLVAFDTEAIELKISELTIDSYKARAQVASAEAHRAAAEIQREEFLQGTSVVQELELKLEVVDAEGNYNQAVRVLESLVASGAAGQEVELAEFELKRAELNLERCQTAARVFEQFTKPRNLAELEAQIVAASAELDAASVVSDVIQNQRDLAIRQLEKCVIMAPSDGMVSLSQSRANRRSEIREGTQVRENQVIMHIVDPTQLKVVLQIDESEIERVRPGQDVSLSLPDRPDVRIEATVTSVASAPDPQGWQTDGSRTYTVSASIEGSVDALQAGMTVAASILVE